ASTPTARSPRSRRSSSSRFRRWTARSAKTCCTRSSGSSPTGCTSRRSGKTASSARSDRGWRRRVCSWSSRSRARHPSRTCVSRSSRPGGSMAYDLIVRNGMIVDGTGFARYRADVGVKDGKITGIGRIRASAPTRATARTTTDADGQFVAPGIIDLHTHYDAQPFWDRLCTSSIWHGVTTVLTGNCGLTLAPRRPEHRDPMLATFCCVEDLPFRSLASVLPWTWETFDEYLKAIDIGLGLNMMPLVGHNPLRLSAMGQAAWDRAATEDETRTMQDLLRASMEAGGVRGGTTHTQTYRGEHT